jgi:hypothetical protein
MTAGGAYIVLYVCARSATQKAMSAPPACPAGAQDSSRGQRPRKAPRSSPDPEGVELPRAAGRKIGVALPDSTLSGSDLVEGTFSGGAAPGYCIDPLRGSPGGRRDGKTITVPAPLSRRSTSWSSPRRDTHSRRPPASLLHPASRWGPAGERLRLVLLEMFEEAEELQ